MERVEFKKVALVKPLADREFSRLAAIIAGLVPASFVEHVGGTALPSGLTKGDLDIQVRVSARDFDAAKASLESVFALDPKNVWGEGAASFAVADAALPVGIHLTVIGGEFDFQWRYRDALSSRPELLREYDALKRRFDGKSMSAYRKAKDEFFGRLRKIRTNREP